MEPPGIQVGLPIRHLESLNDVTPHDLGLPPFILRWRVKPEILYILTIHSRTEPLSSGPVAPFILTDYLSFHQASIVGDNMNTGKIKIPWSQPSIVYGLIIEVYEQFKPSELPPQYKNSDPSQVLTRLSDRILIKIKQPPIAVATVTASETAPYFDFLMKLAAEPRKPNRAKLHYVSYKEAVETAYPGYSLNILKNDEEKRIEFEESEIGIATFILRGKGADIRRGDILLTGEGIGYRNHGKTIFNGKDFIPLANSPDDYGTVPKEFQIGEFPPRYWIEVIDHNYLVPIDVKSKMPWLSANNVVCAPLVGDEGSCRLIIPFTVGDRRYAIVDRQIMSSSKRSSPEWNQRVAKLVATVKGEDYLDAVSDDERLEPIVGYGDEDILLAPYI